MGSKARSAENAYIKKYHRRRGSKEVQKLDSSERVGMVRLLGKSFWKCICELKRGSGSSVSFSVMFAIKTF